MIPDLSYSFADKPFEDSFMSVMDVTDPRNSILKTVLHMIDDNIDHFKNDDGEMGQRLHSGFKALKDGLICISKQNDEVRRELSLFDFSCEVPGSGFRSFCNMVQQSIVCVFDLCKDVCSKRSSVIMFRKGHFVREVEAWGQTVASISTLMDYLITTLLPRCEDGNLVPDVETSPTELIGTLNNVSQYSFYGRCLGFHYHESLQKTLKFLNISMSAFSEVYYSDGGFMQRTKQSFLTGGKYVLDPEKRARRIVDVVQYSSVDFIKAFWSIADTELLTQLPSIVGPSMSVQQPIVVPCEDQEVMKVDDSCLVVIPAPSSHFEPRPIMCYLLSEHLREGMPGIKENRGSKVLPPSPYLVIHCHGGGFVTQSTKAQEVFLRQWAVDLGVPILSIDYSLAPEARYPRPLEEVLTVYAWVLKNFQLLGTTGSKIIFTGDSAGGNLVTGLTLKCIELGIRPPDGLFLAYTPFVFKMVPTPARLLAVLDPMLPLGFALRCLKAYAGIPSICSSIATSPDSQQPCTFEPPTTIIQSADPTCTKSPDNGSDTDSFVNVSAIDIKEAEREMKKNNLLTPEPDDDTLTTVSLTSETSRVNDLASQRSLSKTPEVGERNEQSRQYVNEFLEKYVLDTKTSVDGRQVPILRTGSQESEIDDSLPENTTTGSGITAKFGRAKDAVFSGFSYGLSSFGLKRKDNTPSMSPTPPTTPTSPLSPTAHKNAAKRPSIGRINLGTTQLRQESCFSLLEEFRGIDVIDDHYLSPLSAKKEILAKFPPTSIMTVEFDFCLDDCVTMAKTLRKLDVPVTLDVLDKLPHGFLNLSLLSKEAYDGCKVATSRMKGLLDIDNTDEIPEIGSEAVQSINNDIMPDHDQTKAEKAV